MSDTKLQNFRIDKSLHKEFHMYCIKHSTTMTDVLIGYIEHLLREQKKPVPKRTPNGEMEKQFDPLGDIRNNYK
jgi:hypothetical protein